MSKLYHSGNHQCGENCDGRRLSKRFGHKMGQLASGFKEVNKGFFKSKKQLHARRGFDRNSSDIPPIVQVTCDWLEKNALKTEGIFRISGPYKELMELKRRIEKGKNVDLNACGAYIVSGALKQFFIEPEESILTEELQESFLQAASFDDDETVVHCLSSAVFRLPAGNKAIFQRLCRLLRMAASPENSNISKMGAANLAIVFAPTILRREKQTIDSMLSDNEKAKRLVQLFIERYDDIFSVQKPQEKEKSSEMENFYNMLKLSTIRLAQSKLREAELTSSRFSSVSEDDIEPESLSILRLTNKSDGAYSSFSSSSTMEDYLKEEPKTKQNHSSNRNSFEDHKKIQEIKPENSPEISRKITAEEVSGVIYKSESNDSEISSVSGEIFRRKEEVEQLVKEIDTESLDAKDLICKIEEKRAYRPSFSDSYELLNQVADNFMVGKNIRKDFTWCHLHESLFQQQE